MPVKAARMEPRCKICSHDRRPEIDLILELRSVHGKLPNGKVATLTPVLQILGSEFGIENPTKENIDTHWKKHCEVVETLDEATSDMRLIAEAIASEIGDDWETRILRPDDVEAIVYSHISKKLLRSMIDGAPLGGAELERWSKLGDSIKRHKGGGAFDDLNDALAAAAEELVA